MSSFLIKTICKAECLKNFNRPKNGPVTAPFFGQVDSLDNLRQFTVFKAETPSEVASECYNVIILIKYLL